MNSLCSSSLTQIRVSLVLSLLLLLNVQFSSSQNVTSQLCRNFGCGNMTASFPFWGEDRPVSCGHPNLRLQCDKNTSLLVLEIEEAEYNVLRIDYNSQSIRVARKDYLSGSVCSAQLVNTTLDSSLFDFQLGYENLTIFYGCDIRPSEDPLNFTCSDTGVGSLANNPEYFNDCITNVNVTVPESFSVNPPSGALSRLGRVLKEGFVLRFSTKLKTDYYLCQDCVASGGVCGYNYTNPVCYCRNGIILRGKCSSSAYTTISQPPLVSQPPEQAIADEPDKSLWKIKLAIGLSVASAAIIAISIALVLRKLRKPGKARENTWNGQNVESFIMLKRYSYSKVRKMTNSFAHILGRGGFGTVYKGKLPNGRNIAVKILNESKGNGEEFINEVASMSRTSHVNIVSLLGFCYEGTKRAIIYEFIPNGSLDKFSSEKISSKMEWKTLYDIAAGVARGLEYLHNRCNTRIVHFDIKPQNILLDEDLCPKISDFGLAKLCEKKESIMSLLDARGTVGYIAPEVLSKNYGRVSHKSDVYSYGMLVLEMIGARNNDRTENSASNTSSMYFPDWIYKDLERGEKTRLFGEQITEEEEETAKKMVLVGLWCIQTNPSDRPPMSKVVEMMEGSLEDLQVPPKPVLYFSAAAAAPEAEEENSSSSEPSRQEGGSILTCEDNDLPVS